MKKIMLVTVLLCATLFSFAANNKSAELAAGILKLKPYQATMEEVKSVLGEPDKKDIGQKEVIWHYNREGFSATVLYDNSIMRVKKINFSSKEKADGDWNNKNSQYLITEKSTPENIVKLLGQPLNMSIDLENQKMQYEYKRNFLRLQFIQGKLVSYELSWMYKNIKT